MTHSRMMVGSVALLVVSASTIGAAPSIHGTGEGRDLEPLHVTDNVVIRLADDIRTIEEAQEVLGDEYEVQRVLVESMGIFSVKLKPSLTAFAATSQLRSNAHVHYVQKDHIATLRNTTPDDTDFEKQWSLKNTETDGADIKATDAWEIGTGGTNYNGEEIVVAVIDGGMDIEHPDLVDNLYINKAEIPDNGIDDDENGYIDDVSGWDAFSNDATIPKSSHGTHVAGIIGARGDNDQGISGINWNVKILPIWGSSGQTSIIAAAYGYVIKQKELYLESGGEKGANIVVTNSSFGVDYADCNSGDYPLWNDLYEKMGELGILSAAATINNGIDVDEEGDVPTGCSSEFIISVTNTDINDRKYSRAGFGETTIDLGAPGTNIYSTTPDDTYRNMTGTSMATPHVAGAVAFLHSVASKGFQEAYEFSPKKASLLLKKMMMETVDPLDDLAGKTVSGGRLNLLKAAEAIQAFE